MCFIAFVDKKLFSFIGQLTLFMRHTLAFIVRADEVVNIGLVSFID